MPVVVVVVVVLVVGKSNSFSVCAFDGVWETSRDGNRDFPASFD